MDALWSIAGGVVLFLFIRWVIDVYRHRDPLDEFEILRLSRKRQRSRAFAKYDFSTESQVADPAEKKAMKSQGEFMRCDLDYRSAPARIAGLLKYKKHEWVVFGLIVGFLCRPQRRQGRDEWIVLILRQYGWLRITVGHRLGSPISR